MTFKNRILWKRFPEKDHAGHALRKRGSLERIIIKEIPSSKRTLRRPRDYVGKVALLLHGVEKLVPDLQKGITAIDREKREDIYLAI